VESLGHRWLTYWHGQMDVTDVRYFRCVSCRRLVTWNGIHRGACVCGIGKMSPDMLTFWEKVRLLCLPWTVR